MSKKAFVVFIDEIQQNFVFGQPFVGSYKSTVTMSDGQQRTVTLTPMTHEGREVIQFNDSGNISYMPRVVGWPPRNRPRDQTLPHRA